MAGASLAAALAPQMRVLLLEAEDHPGYHATGRSAAFWSETYGGPLVQPLTTASGPFLAHPPADFAEHSFLRTRGLLMIGRSADAGLAADFMRDFSGSGVVLDPIADADVWARLPGARPDWRLGIWEASNADIDVGALHQAFLRRARQAGVDLAVRRAVTRLTHATDGWTLHAGTDQLRARRVVNAAGAWASDIAARAGAAPIAIRPLRRTMVQARLGCTIDAHLPLVIDLAGRFYFKPEGTQRVWLSPHDETPTDPCDAAPDREDVAHAIARFEEVVDWPIAAVERSWAGLRSFTPDRAPVFGLDPNCPDFYWCAGQGGAGIQTSPAISALLAAEILGVPVAAPYAGVDTAQYRPGRFF
ncbi:MAG: hypothetical protein RJB22_2017 [Pseudomonadota bacterium]